jgi:type IV fimbrial biogenesis protein FimT
MLPDTVKLPRNQGGFTIVELIIVVVIAAVLAAIAMPNLSEFIKDNARATRVNTMVTALNFGRGQAVTRNTRVSVCKSAGFANCDGGAGAHLFHQGWIVFTDGSTRGTVDGTDQVIRIFQPDMGGTATMHGRNGGGNINGISYRNNGMAEDITAGATLLTAGTIFNYCDDRGPPKARAIVVNTTGHIRLTRDVDFDGIDEFGGADLVCP